LFSCDCCKQIDVLPRAHENIVWVFISNDLPVLWPAHSPLCDVQPSMMS